MGRGGAFLFYFSFLIFFSFLFYLEEWDEVVRYILPIKQFSTKILRDFFCLISTIFNQYLRYICITFWQFNSFQPKFCVTFFAKFQQLSINICITIALHLGNSTVNQNFVLLFFA